MLKCGLLGETLGHSYSPQIHSLLGEYEYKLYEKPRDELEDFILRGAWDGLNVTIPYKKEVVKYCDSLSEAARTLGSVNTLVRRDGKIFGDNTDLYGFQSMLRVSETEVSGKKALVLGSGGASVTVCAALSALGANVVVISRSGEDNYTNLYRNANAQIIVNTTPVGMYPKNGEKPLSLAQFPKLERLLDIVYNPARTALVLEAESLGIKNKSGLHMLVAQAKRSSELFTGSHIPDSEISRIEKIISRELQNIVLIGMPGSGKSTVAALLGKMLSRPVVETDALIEERSGMSIPEIFAKLGETEFRKMETAVLAEASKQSGAILSTGGGCVTKEENYPLLHQNGIIFRINRAISSLPTDGRPLSQASPLAEMAAKREAMYARFADFTVENDRAPEDAARAIKELIE